MTPITAKFRAALIITGLMAVIGSSLTAMAFEIKDGSVSKYLEKIGKKPAEIKPETQSAGLPVISNAPTPAPAESAAPAPSETIAQSTAKKTNSSQTQTTTNSETASSSGSSDNSTATNNSANSASSNSSSNNSNASNNSTSSGSTNEPASSAPSAPATSPTIFGNYSATSIDSIVSALGLVFDDALGDYAEPGGGGPPSGVYDYAPIDQDNIYMGVRDGRLYIKTSLGGAIPTSQETIDPDKIESITFNIYFSKVEQPDTSAECGGVETLFQTNIEYHDDGQIWYNSWFSANCTNTAPYQNNHDWQFEKTGSGTAHTSDGGLGKNSIVWSYALSDLASTITVGESVKIFSYSEAESNNWDHYSFDNGANWTDWTVAEI